MATKLVTMNEYGAVSIKAVANYKKKLLASTDPLEVKIANEIGDFYFVEDQLKNATTKAQKTNIQYNTNFALMTLGLIGDTEAIFPGGSNYVKKFLIFTRATALPNTHSLPGSNKDYTGKVLFKAPGTGDVLKKVKAYVERRKLEYGRGGG